MPCIVRWPGHVPADSESGEMWMTIDLLPTIARLTGAALPERTIDGLDVWPLISGAAGAKNPHEGYFFYYAQNELQAVTSGNWKLILPHHFPSFAGRTGRNDGKPTSYERTTVSAPELYDLAADREEKHNVAAAHPEIIERLEVLAEKGRAELGDSLTKRTGTGAREPGRLQAAAQ